MSYNNNTIISIGRENCNINIPNNKVSRHHADIKVVGGGGQTKYMFEDHSSNGTVIDSRKVHNESVEIFPNQNPQILSAGVALLNLDLLHNSAQSKETIVSHVQTFSNTVIQKIRHGFTTVPKNNHAWIIAAAVVAVILIGVAVSRAGSHDVDEQASGGGNAYSSGQGGNNGANNGNGYTPPRYTQPKQYTCPQHQLLLYNTGEIKIEYSGTYHKYGCPYGHTFWILD